MALLSVLFEILSLKLRFLFQFCTSSLVSARMQFSKEYSMVGRLGGGVAASQGRGGGARSRNSPDITICFNSGKTWFRRKKIVSLNKFELPPKVKFDIQLKIISNILSCTTLHLPYNSRCAFEPVFYAPIHCYYKMFAHRWHGLDFLLWKRLTTPIIIPGPFFTFTSDPSQSADTENFWVKYGF